MKDSPIVKRLRKKHRGQYLSGEADVIKDSRIMENTAADYQELRRYYGSMIALFDSIHANSTVTKNVFSKYFDCEEIHVIHITHSDIRDNRKIKKFVPDYLQITYLGPGGGAKGFFILRRLSTKCG